MPEFVSQKNLSKRIRGICSGSDVRCAVAFWGKGAVRELFGNGDAGRTIRILCDIEMGGTNPDELELLRDMPGCEVRVLKGLHAKVWISEEGVVVGSANASNNGIGFQSEIGDLIEVGTAHGLKSKIGQAADDWFKKVWRKGKRLSEEQVERARLLWNRRIVAGMKAHPPASEDRLSALDLLRDCPEAFDDVGIKVLLVRDRIKPKVAKRARQKAKDEAERDGSHPGPGGPCDV